MGGAAAPSRSGDPWSHGTHGLAGVHECRAKPRDCENVRSSSSCRNETRSLSWIPGFRV